MKNIIIIAAIVIFLGFYTIGEVFFIVSESDQVILTQFGNPVGSAIAKPGLHFKLPFVQVANYFEKRFIPWDGEPNQIPTKDKRFIWVDTYARWRISDPLLFLQRLKDERKAITRIDDILDGETRNVVARYDLIELVKKGVVQEISSGSEPIATSASNEASLQINYGRDHLAREVLKTATKPLAEMGIELLDFRFKRINYVDAVRKEVYARMISERKRIAEEYRSEGHGEAARIEGEKERAMRTIYSEAYKQAQQIRGQAEAKATEIYANAYSKDPNFYRFTKTMDTYRAAFQTNTSVVLSTESDFLEKLTGERKITK